MALGWRRWRAGPVARGLVVGLGFQVEEELVAVLVAAAGLGQPLVSAGPVHGELADQVMFVEDDEVVAGANTSRVWPSSSRPVAMW